MCIHMQTFAQRNCAEKFNNFVKLFILKISFLLLHLLHLMTLIYKFQSYYLSTFKRKKITFLMRENFNLISYYG
jgi:hypothetical protein